MQLIRHLKDEELTEVLLQNEEMEVRQVLGAVPESLQSITEKPEWFWQRQRARVRGRIGAATPNAFRPMAVWASALALGLLAFSLLNSKPAAKPAVEAQNDSDQALLLAVEQAVEEEGPASLAPATLLTDEIRSAQPASQATHIRKAVHDEN
jgi:hypothetical protein